MNTSTIFVEKLLDEVRRARDMAYAEVHEAEGEARGHIQEAAIDLDAAVRSLERAVAPGG